MTTNASKPTIGYAIIHCHHISGKHSFSLTDIMTAMQNAKIYTNKQEFVKEVDNYLKFQIQDDCESSNPACFDETVNEPVYCRKPHTNMHEYPRGTEFTEEILDSMPEYSLDQQDIEDYVICREPLKDEGVYGLFCGKQESFVCWICKFNVK